MIINKIYAVYFSPTGGTKKIVYALANNLSASLPAKTEYIDLTIFENRKKVYKFDQNSLVLLATPVYAGRIPNKLLPDLEKCMQGNHTPVIPICVYGNRNYDETLRELLLLSENLGFIPIGAATMISQHAFSRMLAKDRPDTSDLQELEHFSIKISTHIQTDERPVALNYDRTTPIGPYYTPLKADLSPAHFLKAKPVTDMQKCNACGICVTKCPMASISAENASEISGICIKCQACIQCCPAHAKSFTDEDFLSHVQMLEATYTKPKKPEFYLP